MEEKFKKFLEYNWKTSKEWNNYYQNDCYITAPVTPEKIIKARKKFYKLKVDPDFDINYTPPTMPINEHTCHNHTKKPEHKSILTQIICAIEGFLWVAFFMNMLLPRFILDIILVSVSIRFLRLNISKIFKYEFYKTKEIFKDDMFQLALYSFILRTDHINYLNLFPFTSTALFCVCEYFVDYLRIFQFTKKYFQKVVDAKEKIFHCRGFAFIFYGIYLIIAIPIRWSSLLVGFIYPIFLVYLYHYNLYVKEATHKLKRFPSNILKRKLN